MINLLPFSIALILLSRKLSSMRVLYYVVGTLLGVAFLIVIATWFVSPESVKRYVLIATSFTQFSASWMFKDYLVNPWTAAVLCVCTGAVASYVHVQMHDLELEDSPYPDVLNAMIQCVGAALIVIHFQNRFEISLPLCTGLICASYVLENYESIKSKFEWGTSSGGACAKITQKEWEEIGKRETEKHMSLLVENPQFKKWLIHKSHKIYIANEDDA